MRYVVPILIVFLIVSFWMASQAQEQSPFAPQYQRVSIPLPTKGLNSSMTGYLPGDQAAVLRNLIVGNQELSFIHCMRSPFKYPADYESNAPVNFVGGYRPSGANLTLILQSGGIVYALDADAESLTAANIITDTAYNSYNISPVNGTLSGTSGNNWVVLDSAGRWKSIFADGSFLTLEIDSAGSGLWSEYKVDYIQDDSVLYLTGNLGYSPANDTFFLTGGVGEIIFGETFVDSFWILAKSGKYVYGNHLTDVTQDTSYYKFDPTSFSLYGVTQSGEVVMRWYIPSAGMGGGGTASKLSGSIAAGGRWYLFVDQGNIGNNGSCIDSLQEQEFWTMFPINRTVSAGRTIETFSSGVTAESDSNPTISIHRLFIDKTSYIKVTADVVLDTAYASGSDPVRIIKVVADTVSGLVFKSGDWFVAPVDSITSDTGAMWRMNVFGRDNDSDTLYANAGSFNATCLDTSISLYRRIKRMRDVGGYNCGVFWRNRFCTVHDSTPSQVDFSVAYYPDSMDEYFVQVSPDDGERILWMREMYGNLIIGKYSSIWKINGIPGLDNFATLEKSWQGASFVVDRSIVTWNNLLFGLGRDGFYVYDFNSMVKISGDIREFLTDTLDWDYYGRIRGEFFDDHYWCTFPRTSHRTEQNFGSLIFDPVNQAWSTSTLSFGDAYIDRTNVVSDTDQVYMGKVDLTQVWVYGRGTTQEVVEWTTGWIDLDGDPWTEEVVTRVMLVYDVANLYPTETEANLSCYLYTDNSYSLSTYSGEHVEHRSLTVSSQGSRKVAKFEFRGDETRGYEHKIRISAPTGVLWTKIGGLAVEYYTESVDY